jgi:hypothetical protein
MWDTPNDHSRGHSRTLVRTTILVVAYLTTIPNLMPNRMSLLLCFCEKYGKLARTDLKNERISRSGGFEACYEIIRGVGGWSESRPESQYKYF